MSEQQPLTYAGVGINLTERQRTVSRFREVARVAARPEVLSGIGPFAGMFALASKYTDPVIVSTTDTVGTKGKIAALVGGYEGLGHDIVNHCINDAFTTGAEPLFFMDTIVSSDLTPDAKVALVKGVADACAAQGIALLGGETADMPGTYYPGAFDLIGFIVGVVERSKLIDGMGIEAGDLLFGLPSNGLHTNGYTLARAALGIGIEGADLSADPAGGWHRDRRDVPRVQHGHRHGHGRVAGGRRHLARISAGRAACGRGDGHARCRPRVEGARFLPTRDEMLRRGLTALEAIRLYKQGKVLREFPSQYFDATLDIIEADARRGVGDARKAKKILFDKRFDK
jgi:phosphoribosylformylglycinamidine cyclo-ligase